MSMHPPADLLREANALIEAGRHAEAEPLLRRTLGEVPSASPLAKSARYGLVSCLLGQDRQREAIDAFRAYVDAHEPACDPQYDDLYADGLAATGTAPFPAARRLRFYELVGQLDHSLALGGWVAECGCFRGLSAYLMSSYLQLYDETFDGTGFAVFDSFQGLSTPTAEDVADGADRGVAGSMREGKFAAPLALVRTSLAKYPGIEFRPGWIPDSFAALPERRYRFVHVDVDLYAPTRACVEYFYPRLVPGGRLVCDDYNWPGARRAIDAFCAAHGLRVGTTDFNQAIVAKA